MAGQFPKNRHWLFRKFDQLQLFALMSLHDLYNISSRPENKSFRQFLMGM
jgi:hypothetical protein